MSIKVLFFGAMNRVGKPELGLFVYELRILPKNPLNNKQSCVLLTGFIRIYEWLTTHHSYIRKTKVNQRAYV